jgi:hypothetical protein
MKTKVSKAQTEVWDAKERLSAELLKLPVSKRIPYIVKQTKSVVTALKRKRKLPKAA